MKKMLSNLQRCSELNVTVHIILNKYINTCNALCKCMCEGQTSMSGVILNIFSEIRFITEPETY